MWNRSQRQAVGRLFLRRLGLIALFAVVVAALFGVWGVYQKERETAASRAQAESEHADLAARETRLSDDIEHLTSDRGVEETLREQYGLAERGEGLIVIVDTPNSVPTEATSTVRQWLSRLFPWW